MSTCTAHGRGREPVQPTVSDRRSRGLDVIEAHEGPCALVTTGAGKFFSNGLDLEWLGSGDDTTSFLDRVHALLGRILGLNVYTVAASERPRVRRRCHARRRSTTVSSCGPTGATGACPRSIWGSRSPRRCTPPSPPTWSRYPGSGRAHRPPVLGRGGRGSRHRK